MTQLAMPFYTNIGTHQDHCCLKHGCKYGGYDPRACPVEDGFVKQDYPCEYCLTEERKVDRIISVLGDYLGASKHTIKRVLLENYGAWDYDDTY